MSTDEMRKWINNIDFGLENLNESKEDSDDDCTVTTRR